MSSVYWDAYDAAMEVYESKYSPDRDLATCFPDALETAIVECGCRHPIVYRAAIDAMNVFADSLESAINFE